MVIGGGAGGDGDVCADNTPTIVVSTVGVVALIGLVVLFQYIR